MMNKYTHHLSVAFVVSLEKFPIIGQKKSLPEIRFTSRTGGGVFYGVLERVQYSCNYCAIIRSLTITIHAVVFPLIFGDVIFTSYHLARSVAFAVC